VDSKELIVKPKNLDKAFLEYLHFKGIKSLVLNPEDLNKVDRGAFKVYSEKEEADIYLTSNYDESLSGKRFAFTLNIDSPDKIELAKELAKKGAEALFIETKDWKIIPLENLLAEIKPYNLKVISKADKPEEIPTLLGILEKGVDGVLIEAKDFEDVERAIKGLKTKVKLELKVGKVKEVKDLDLGERVCVDTTSILNLGEGLLVGNKANFFFLIHNESIGSTFTSPRPFRVNAGAVHSYTLLPNGKTKYLSELSAGDEILIIDREGYGRVVNVGRAKIERRPLKLVKAEVEGEEGSVIVQNAETIRFIKPNGEVLAVTDIKKEDEVLVYLSESKGRHFGISINEFIIEK